MGGPLKQAASVGFGKWRGCENTCLGFIFQKIPAGIACFLEQAEQRAGGSILGSTGAARIQFHVYFLPCRAWSKLSFHLNTSESLPPSI